MPLLSIFSVIILSKAVFLIPPYTSIFGFFGVNLPNTFFDATIFGVVVLIFVQGSSFDATIFGFFCWHSFCPRYLLLMSLSSDFRC